MAGRAVRQPGILLGRVFLLSSAVLAGSLVLLIAGIGSDVLVLGPRPDGDWQWFLFQKWPLSLALGLVVGGFVAAYTAFLYRRHRDFYAEFFSTSLRSRSKGHLSRRNLILGIPVLAAIEGFIVASFLMEFAPLPGFLALFLFFPFLIKPAAEVRRLAAQRQQRKSPSAAESTAP